MRFLTRLMILILFISIYTAHLHDVGDSRSQEKGDGEDVSERNKRATAETEYTDKIDYASWNKCGDIGYDHTDDVSGERGVCFCTLDNVTIPAYWRWTMSECTRVGWLLSQWRNCTIDRGMSWLLL